MKTIKLLLLASVLLVTSAGTLQAQFMKKVGEAAKRSAENAALRKTEEKTDGAVSSTIDKATNPDTYKDNDSGQEKAKTWTCPKCKTKGNTGKFCTNCGEKQLGATDTWTCTACGHEGNKGKFCTECGAQQPDAPPQKKQTSGSKQTNSGQAAAEEQKTLSATSKTLEAAYAKSDFVPGDEIIFADDLSREKSGEFPSRWDLIEGNAEIAKLNGYNAIFVDPLATIGPLMKNSKAYLPDVFTAECDITIDNKGQWGRYEFSFFDADEQVFYVSLGLFTEHQMEWIYRSTSNDERAGVADMGNVEKPGDWNHVAFSFNKRAFKMYINGTRVINIPAMAAPKRMEIRLGTNAEAESTQPFAIKDFRIAKGAVPLYDRMMSDGKIISYGITFDVGKSILKPESMSEINRIAQLMKDNPAVKFSVEGHTDNTGSAAANQTLSDARSKAVMNKLIELGVDKNRLAAAGKGQNNPLADNSTDEGRAKNRRVEFVKL